MTKTRKIPPDGGYGWMIVGAFALHHLIVLPIMQGSGLMFKDAFKELGFSATDIAIILNTHSASVMFVAILSGPLLRNFGYRKVAFIGATLITLGVISSAFANSFATYMMTYGFLAASGISMGFSCYPLALNCYFVKRRSIATGYAIAICGLGPVFLPQVISVALEFYGITGGVLIVGAFCSHLYVGACLLQPAKWHLKPQIIEEGPENLKLLKTDNENIDDTNASNRKDMYAIEEEPDQNLAGEIFGLNSLLAGSMPSLHSVRQERSMSVSSRKVSFSRSISRYSAINLTEIDSEKKAEEDRDVNPPTKKIGFLKVFGIWIVDALDLTLLTNFTHVNVMLGMAFDIFTEINFLNLIPFILQDYGLNTQDIATFMSTLAIVDICFRFIAPYVSNFFKQPVRVMHMFALTLLILSRFCMLISTNYIALLACAAFIGLARGFRMVYLNLVIPAHIPIDRFAAALGLQSVINGILITIGGPFLGYVRDVAGSYTICIFLINFLTSLAIIAWGAEFAYKYWKTGSKTAEIKDGDS